MNFPKVGEILPNGHTVDAAYCVGDARYVLAHRDGEHEQFVVWSVDQDGDTVNGRYFDNPVAAQKKFAECCFDWLAELNADFIQIPDEDIGHLRESTKRAVSEQFSTAEKCNHSSIAFQLAHIEILLQKMPEMVAVVQLLEQEKAEAARLSGRRYSEIVDLAPVSVR